MARSIRSDPRSTVPGHGITTSPEIATFANGVMLRCSDWNASARVETSLDSITPMSRQDTRSKLDRVCAHQDLASGLSRHLQKTWLNLYEVHDAAEPLRARADLGARSTL
jgi:hypothetical protein